MAQEIAVDKLPPNLCNYTLGGQDCLTRKAVDITEETKGRRLLLIFFGTDEVRRVCLQSPYDGEEFMGSFVFFPVDDLDAWMNKPPKDDTFGSWAEMHNLDRDTLGNLIKEHAPVHWHRNQKGSTGKPVVFLFIVWKLIYSSSSWSITIMHDSVRV